jgi:hypothetical protein
MRNTYETKRSQARPKHRWKDNMKMDIKEIKREVMNWIQLAQDRVKWRILVNSVMTFQVP